MARTPIKINPKDVGSIKTAKEAEPIFKSAENDFMKLNQANQIRMLMRLGCGDKFFTCQRCGEVKIKDDFYVSSEATSKSKITNICKNCAAAIAMPKVNGKITKPTKESVNNALYALDKPFLESVWDSSILESANGRGESAMLKTTPNVYYTYIKNIQLPNYYTMTYRESDTCLNGAVMSKNKDEDQLPANEEILAQFEKNKSDTLRLIGYLPFEKEQLSDQPFLYSQLIGFLDSSEEGNDDMMRTSSIISIVRGFLQKSHIDDQIAELCQDTLHAADNLPVIKALQEMQKNITISITKLAQESCISLKNNKTSKKGENTWTGKLKKIRDLDLREGKLNGFDLETCKGMQQVADISMSSILKALHFDESEWADMVAEQRKKIGELTEKSDSYFEAFRILLQENLDLRDKLKEQGLLNDSNLCSLDNVVNTYIFNRREINDEKTS